MDFNNPSSSPYVFGQRSNWPLRPPSPHNDKRSPWSFFPSTASTDTQPEKAIDCPTSKTITTTNLNTADVPPTLQMPQGQESIPKTDSAGLFFSSSTDSIANTGAEPERSIDCPTPRTISTNLNTEDVPPPLHMSQSQEHFPQAGKTFLIRSHGDKDLVLEQTEGDVRVSPRCDAGLGVAWHCVRSQNWLGFRNSVSGHYLQQPDLMSSPPKPQGTSFNDLASFVVERHRHGGYVIMGLDLNKTGLLQMAISLDGKGLTMVNEGGTAWDFVEIDDVDVAYKFARLSASSPSC